MTATPPPQLSPDRPHKQQSQGKRAKRKASPVPLYLILSSLLAKQALADVGTGVSAMPVITRRKSEKRRLDSSSNSDNVQALSPETRNVEDASVVNAAYEARADQRDANSAIFKDVLEEDLDGPDERNQAKVAEILQRIQDQYNSGKTLTPITPYSYEPSLSQQYDGLSKKAYNVERQGGGHSNPPQRRSSAAFRYTGQRSPFHSSQVGALSTRQPAPMSVGIFEPEYPFTPSGRRKLRSQDVQSRKRRQAYGQAANYSDMRAEEAPYESCYSISDDVAYGNVMKKGWSRWMLDDDARLATPDARRRPRRETAIELAKTMAGKKWYRWKPGEGYVLGRYKDYTAYKQGPGIALGQLMPPRERPYRSTLPLIPNDSKRDLAWMVFWWIFLLSCLAIFVELRAHLRSARKGKRRSNTFTPAIFLTDDDENSSPVRASSIAHASIGLRTRQRAQARNFRDMCKAALFPSGSIPQSGGGSSGVGDGESGKRLTHQSGQSMSGGSAAALANSRQSEDESVPPLRSKTPPSYALNNIRWNMSIINGGGSAQSKNGKASSGVLPVANHVDPALHHQHQQHQQRSMAASARDMTSTTDSLLSVRLSRSHSFDPPTTRQSYDVGILSDV